MHLCSSLGILLLLVMNLTYQRKLYKLLSSNIHIISIINIVFLEIRIFSSKWLIFFFMLNIYPYTLEMVLLWNFKFYLYILSNFTFIIEFFRNQCGILWKGKTSPKIGEYLGLRYAVLAVNIKNSVSKNTFHWFCMCRLPCKYFLFLRLKHLITF